LPYPGGTYSQKPKVVPGTLPLGRAIKRDELGPAGAPLFTASLLIASLFIASLFIASLFIAALFTAPLPEPPAAPQLISESTASTQAKGS